MNKGQRALADLVAGGLSQGAIARSIGATRSLVTRWLQGRQKPTTRYRVLLERIHGIGLTWWDEPVAEQRSAA